MQRSARRHPAVAVIAVAAAALTCRPAAPTPRPSSLILITLDTTRADRLPPYGGATGAMPAIDRLAREGVVFDDAMTVAPLTLPAHCSLFTGRLPPFHGARDNADVLDAGVTTLADALRAAGYRTAAFVSATVLDADRGLARGFDVYREVNRHDQVSPRRRFRRPADEVIDEALSWLELNGAARFFAWIHLYDAHAPQSLPEPYQTAYADDPYQGALAFADAQVGRLLKVLDDRQLLSSTAVIVAADHGESLGDHGEQGHGIFVYQSVLRVPLVVRWPGVQPRRVATLVQLTDVAPTILALEQVPPPLMDGTSLVPLLKGLNEDERDGYAESLYPRRFGWSELRAFRAGRFKLIAAPRPELYDLEVDPGESNNIYARRPGTAEALLAQLQRFGPDPRQGNSLAARDVTDGLTSLGYAGGRDQASFHAPNLLPDPKDKIAQYNAIVEQRARLRGR